MAFKTMADNGVSISAKRDGALYNVACGGVNFIIKGIGQEFAYSVSGLTVTVGTGEAIIHGRHVTAEASNSLRLPTNSSGYLVLRLDLSQTSGNEAYLYATPTLTNEEINWNGNISDMVIASYTTTATRATLTNQRVIIDSISGGTVLSVGDDGKPYISYYYNNEFVTKKLGSVDGTANASQVLSGATFMSANSENVQTGALPYNFNKVVSYAYAVGSSSRVNTFNYTVTVNAKVRAITIANDTAGSSAHVSPQIGTLLVTYSDGTTETLTQNYTATTDRYSYHGFVLHNTKTVSSVKYTYKDGGSGTFQGKSYLMAVCVA